MDCYVNSCISSSGQWDTHILLSLVPPHIVSHICSIYIPSETQSDSLIWGLTADVSTLLSLGLCLPKACFLLQWKKLNIVGFGLSLFPLKLNFFVEGL